MTLTQADTPLPMPEDAVLSSSVIKPMLLRPRFMKESDLLLHLPFLFWLVNAVRPARSAVLGLGNGVAFLALCQAIEEFSIQGRCTGKRVGDTSRPAPQKIDAPVETLYEGLADLHDHATLDEALSDIGSGSLDLLFVDLCDLAGAGISDPVDWMEKLSPGGCLVVHGSDEADETTQALKRKIEGIFDSTLLFFDLGAGLTVVLKHKILTGAARGIITLGGNGRPCKADSLLLRRLGQGLMAIARHDDIAKRLAEAEERLALAQKHHDKTEQDLAALKEAYEARNRKIWELQAIGFDRENESRNFQKYQQTLSDSVAALTSALETIQKEKDSLSEALSEKLRVETDRHYKETAVLTRLLEQKNAAEQAEMKNLRRQVQTLSAHNAALLSSTSWRITAPMRKIKMKLTGK